MLASRCSVWVRGLARVLESHENKKSYLNRSSKCNSCESWDNESCEVHVEDWSFELLMTGALRLLEGVMFKQPGVFWSLYTL